MNQNNLEQPESKSTSSSEKMLEKFAQVYEKDGFIDAASRFANLADQQERNKNYKLSSDLNMKANQEYLKAIAYLKQKPNVDLKSLDSLNTIAETHRRKAKLMNLRQINGIQSIKSHLNDMILEKKQQEKMNKNQQVKNQDNQKKNSLETKQIENRLKEQFLIVQANTFSEVKTYLDTIIDMEKNNLQKMIDKFQQILEVYHKNFNKQTKELIMSYGDKFVNIQSNPFAKDALKESIQIDQIEKQNQKFCELVEAMKKFKNLLTQRLENTLKKVDDKNKSVQLNLGQLIALSSTDAGRQLGLDRQVSRAHEDIMPYINQLNREGVPSELEESILRNEKNLMSQFDMNASSMGMQSSQSQDNLKKLYLDSLKEQDSLRSSSNILKQQNEELLLKLKKYKKQIQKYRAQAQDTESNNSILTEKK